LYDVCCDDVKLKPSKVLVENSNNCEKGAGAETKDYIFLYRLLKESKKSSIGRNRHLM